MLKVEDFQVGQTVVLNSENTAKITYVGIKPGAKGKRKFKYLKLENFNPPHPWDLL